MDVGLLFLLPKLLEGVVISGPPPSRPDIFGRSKECPPCPKPSSAIYTKTLEETARLRGFQMPVPIRARDQQEVTPRPVTVTIPPVTGEQLTNWWLEATQDIPVTSLPPGAR